MLYFNNIGTGEPVETESDTSGLSRDLIIVIAASVGGGLLLLFIVGLIACCCCCR